MVMLMLGDVHGWWMKMVMLLLRGINGVLEGDFGHAAAVNG